MRITRKWASSALTPGSNHGGTRKVRDLDRDETDLVYYQDHLRHLKLAQIAVLEELLSELVPMSHDNGYRVRAVPQVCFLNKIEEIRREIG